jgi:hypothetical protein
VRETQSSSIHQERRKCGLFGCGNSSSFSFLKKENGMFIIHDGNKTLRVCGVCNFVDKKCDFKSNCKK